MIEIKREIGDVIKVYAETFENEAWTQVKKMGNYPAYANSKIRIMPDAHAGKGCTVGTTMTLIDKVKLNELAYYAEMETFKKQNIPFQTKWVEGFKAGYRKAKEE